MIRAFKCIDEVFNPPIWTGDNVCSYDEHGLYFIGLFVLVMFVLFVIMTVLEEESKDEH